MVTSLVNPHDIMYGNANVSGEEVQQAVDPSLMPPPPSDSIYEKKWDFTLPESVGESLAAAGMPPALAEYKKGWDAWTGGIPADRPDMWTIFYNYYLNAIADVDRACRRSSTSSWMRWIYGATPPLCSPPITAKWAARTAASRAKARLRTSKTSTCR